MTNLFIINFNQNQKSYASFEHFGWSTFIRNIKRFANGRGSDVIMSQCL